MKKILVPTDFSEYSKNALLYAKKVAEKTGAEIVLLNCYHNENSIGINPSEKELTMFDDNNRKSNFTKLNTFLASFNDLHKYKIIALLEPGLPAESILNVVIKENIDLVVMGVKGESNLMEKIFGSVTETVAKNIKCPLLLVPAVNSLRKLDTITYFTSLNQKKDIISDSLISFASELRILLSCIFISTVGINIENQKLVFSLQEGIENKGIAGISSVEIMDNEDVEEGIRQYVALHTPDIIAVNVKKKCFIRDMFLSDIELNLFYELYIPLLLFKDL
jgi:nucleotide-binding universal stress UspA family protein